MYEQTNEPSPWPGKCDTNDDQAQEAVIRATRCRSGEAFWDITGKNSTTQLGADGRWNTPQIPGILNRF